MASVEFDEQLIDRLANRFLPKPRITHPWPSQRFRVKHPRRKPYAWVHRIMSNHFISGVRIRRLFADVVPEQAAPPARVTNRIALHDLALAMDSLLPSLFAVAVAERSFEEVAYETGCPIGTLKSRVHRARLHCVDDEQQLAV